MQHSGSCPLCGSDGDPIAIKEGSYVGRACRCGVTYIDPAPSANEVDPTLDHHHRAYYSVPARTRLAWVHRFMPNGLLLDVGSGYGEFAQVAKEQGYQVEAIEPSPVCAAYLRQKLGIVVEESLVENSNVPDGRYDVAFHVDLLSHFPDPVKGLCAIASKVRDGGVICFEVGLFSNLSHFWKRLAGRPNMPTHRYFYDDEALGRLIDAANLEMVAIKRYSVGFSTALSAILFKTLGRSESTSQRVGKGPLAQGVLSGPYYAFHMWLRYGLGRLIPLPGPQTVLVTAKHKPQIQPA